VSPPTSNAPANPANRPALLLSVDTEADDQWTDAGRRALCVGNAERLPALQLLLESHRVRPTYLVTWEMATREPSRSILRELGRSGACEVGAHLHPWSSPPRRPEDVRGTFPSQLPDALLERQLRELTSVIEDQLGVRPTSYRAGRYGLDLRALPLLESLGYTVDSSVDPLLNERHKGGPCFAGAPVSPYRPDYADVTRPGGARILEIPITAGTRPRLPAALLEVYARLPPLPWRGALKRLGLRPVWLRPSYSSLADATQLASRTVDAGMPALNLLFHSSELLPGASPYHGDEAAVQGFLDRLRRLFDHVIGTLGAEGRTYAEFAAAWRAPA